MQSALQHKSYFYWIRLLAILFAFQALVLSAPARADDYLQCVPYARDLSGIQIYGDAHTWWQQASGRYQRGALPQVGAVLSLKSYGQMELGHVAVVSRIVDNRRILLSHANWSVINGRRGQIERDVAAIDVSPRNDWSVVKIWYAPIGDLGTTAYPANGFIYAASAPRQSDNRKWVKAEPKPTSQPARRDLFAKYQQRELEEAAARENRHQEQPQDLIGELIGRTG